MRLGYMRQIPRKVLTFRGRILYHFKVKIVAFESNQIELFTTRLQQNMAKSGVNASVFLRNI